jgi:hypothetical protein
MGDKLAGCRLANGPVGPAQRGAVAATGGLFLALTDSVTNRRIEHNDSAMRIDNLKDAIASHYFGVQSQAVHDRIDVVMRRIPAHHEVREP